MASYIVKDVNEVTDRIKRETQKLEDKLGRKVEFSE